MTHAISEINTSPQIHATDNLTRQRERGYPKIIIYLFLIFGAYLVLPIIEVPLLGLSLSAPIFFIIAMTCILKPPRPWFRAYRGWIFLALLIWTAIFISTAANGLLSGGVQLETRGVLTVIRYLYWLLVFVITAYFASQGQILQRLTAVLGWSVLALALLRWLEVALYGNLGAWTGTRFLSQNNYGVLFSIFSPFLLINTFNKKHWKRLFAIIGILTVWGAAAINGSRGSWVAIAIGLALCLILLAIARPRKFSGLLIGLFFIIVIVSVLLTAFPQVETAIQVRLDTFQSLDTEKSYMIRQLMIQKGIKLFNESPLIGVGASRFTEESIILEIPQLLSYANQEHFDSKSAHNSYIAFLAEYGLLGSIPFGILLVILSLRGGFATVRSIKEGSYWILPVFLSFAQMGIHMWAISSITTTGTWFTYGLTAAIIVLQKKQGVKCV